MHIAFMVKILGPHGGTEEYIRTVSEALVERGHDLSFLYEERKIVAGPGWARLLSGFPSTQLAGSETHRACAVAAHLAEHRPDALFLHSAWFGPRMYDRAAGRAKLVRFVHDFRPVCLRVAKVFPFSRRNCSRSLGSGCLLHGCSLGPSRGGRLPLSWNRFRRKLAERDTARRFDRVVVASRFMRDLMLANGFPPDRISLNPLFCPSPVPEGPSPISPLRRLLYIGQLERFKGPAILLEALRSLPGVILDMAGDGPSRTALAAKADQWKLADRVRFHGWVERESIDALIRSATVVVVPSIWNEPFGLVGLQAMAQGRPVVAFEVGGISEWLVNGVTGIVASEPSADSLAQAIRKVLGTPGLAARMGQAGFRRVQERFTLERHVNHLLVDLGEPAVPAEMAP